MDPVKALLSATGSQEDALASSHTAPSHTSTSRTKIVFVYSDEDEEGGTASTVKGVHTVDCTNQALAVSDELEADATRFNLGVDGDAGVEDEDNAMGFHEDLVGGPDMAGLGADDVALLDAIAQERGTHMHARVVPAPSIRDGAVSAAAASDEELRPLRHHIHPDELRGALSRTGYKRFRADEDDADAMPSVSAHRTDDVVVAEVVQDMAMRLKPVVSEDGAVRAVETVVGGYRLTVDERDLLEDTTDAGADAAADDAMAEVGDDEDAVNATDDFGLDFDDDDDEEDEEEEALDDAIVVAVAVQLLQCCEADDLDPAMGREAVRFSSVVKPLLARLRLYEAEHPDIPVISDGDDDESGEQDGSLVAPPTTVEPAVAVVVEASEPLLTTEATTESPLAEEDAVDATNAQKNDEDKDDSSPLSPSEFAQRIDYHIRRFQRIFRSVYRPRDEPIIIDGVRMDL